MIQHPAKLDTRFNIYKIIRTNVNMELEQEFKQASTILGPSR
jgi:hypothetical protein